MDNIQLILQMCTPLLTPEEERQLFTRLTHARSIVDRLEKKQKRTTKESSQLGIARKQQKEIMDRIATANLPMVVRMAQKSWVTTLSTQELVTDGLTTLHNCILKFSVDRGYKFSSYLSGALSNAFSRSYSNESKQHQGRISLESTTDDVNEGHEMDVLFATEEANCMDDLIDLREAIGSKNNGLNDAELFLIRNRYGLGKAKPKTIRELGMIIGMTPEGARQVLKKALEKLCEYLER